MQKELYPNMEARKNKEKEEKYSDKEHIRHLVKQLKNISEERHGGKIGPVSQMDPDLKVKVNEFMDERLKFFSLRTRHDTLVQDIKTPSASLTRGKFDEKGVYQPAMFEHLTNERYFEYAAMDQLTRPSNWRLKLLDAMSMSAAEKTEKARRQKEKE